MHRGLGLDHCQGRVGAPGGGAGSSAQPSPALPVHQALYPP